MPEDLALCSPAVVTRILQNGSVEGGVMTIEKICVLGAGQMGAGIAQASAEAGFSVSLMDIEDRFIKSGLKKIARNFDRAISKTMMNRKKAESCLARIRPGTDLSEAVMGADVVIEAVPENIDMKKRLYRELDALCSKDTILASNTSSLSITEIASATNRPQKVIGMHFFYPVPLMQLVEVVKGRKTSLETHHAIAALAKKMTKTPITVEEAPGFVFNRILIPMINEAIFTLHEGLTSAKNIDQAMMLGASHPIGPLALADVIGLDTLLMVQESLYVQFSDTKYRPCPLLKKLVHAGHLGRKTGIGFYTYKTESASENQDTSDEIATT